MGKEFDYNLFNQFIEKYISCGFQDISREDPLIVDMEKRLRQSGQFFYIADLINIKVLFASTGVRDILGIEPSQVGPGTFYRIAHPDELARYNLARAKLFRTGHELYTKQEGVSYLSTQFRLKNVEEQYTANPLSGLFVLQPGSLTIPFLFFLFLLTFHHSSSTGKDFIIIWEKSQSISIIRINNCYR